MIYFIKSGNYCKMGFSDTSKTLFTRMRTYLTHNPTFQILDIQKGNKVTEHELHALIPEKYHHYGEWCIWNKEIAQIWVNYYKIEIQGSLDDYLYTQNKKANKAIILHFGNTPYLNLIRYFKKESNLDLTEAPDD